MSTTATYSEIISQPKAWQDAIEQVTAQQDTLLKFWHSGEFSSVTFIGCGSTYYLSLAAASLFQSQTGVRARAVPSGELVLYPNSVCDPQAKTLLVAISRSGKTTETLHAVRRFKEHARGAVIMITNYGDSPLAGEGAINITIPEGQEESVAQTRSFASMYVAATTLSLVIGGKDDLLEAIHKLPEVGERLIPEVDDLARTIGENLELERIYFLGGETRYGLACEANLKMKEMSLTHSEPFHFLEFRHGPMSMVTEHTLIVGLRSEANTRHEQAVLDEMVALGGTAFSSGEAHADIAFNSGLPEAVRNVLYLPGLQLMGCYRSLAKGLNPDAPHNLSTVIELDGLAS